MRGRGGGVRGSAGRAGPGCGRLGVAHTEMTGFTCRGAGRSPSGMPCLPRQRIKGFESRSEQDDSYICCSICDAERESMDTAAWARNVGQLIRDIFGAEEEEVAEWIRSLGQLIRAGLGLAFAGITAWSIAALSSEESSFAFGRAEHIGFLVVGVLGLFLLADPPAEQSVLPEQKLRAGASIVWGQHQCPGMPLAHLSRLWSDVSAAARPSAVSASAVANSTLHLRVPHVDVGAERAPKGYGA